MNYAIKITLRINVNFIKNNNDEYNMFACYGDNIKDIALIDKEVDILDANCQYPIMKSNGKIVHLEIFSYGFPYIKGFHEKKPNEPLCYTYYIPKEINFSTPPPSARTNIRNEYDVANNYFT